MRKSVLMAAVAPLTMALTACYDADEANYADNGYNAAEAAENGAYETGGNASAYGNQSASSGWPAGSRIVVEDGVTYRIEPGGTRVRLGDSDSRIVIDNGVRYRVDPGGVRVRIDDSGAVIGVDTSVPVNENTSVVINQN